MLEKDIFGRYFLSDVLFSRFVVRWASVLFSFFRCLNGLFSNDSDLQRESLTRDAERTRAVPCPYPADLPQALGWCGTRKALSDVLCPAYTHALRDSQCTEKIEAHGCLNACCHYMYLKSYPAFVASSLWTGVAGYFLCAGHAVLPGFLCGVAAMAESVLGCAFLGPLTHVMKEKEIERICTEYEKNKELRLLKEISGSLDGDATSALWRASQEVVSLQPVGSTHSLPTGPV